MSFNTSNRAVVRQELRELVLLAVPVALGELGWMSMSVVDTAMVGRLNAVAIGAVGLGSILYHTIVLFGFGLLLSMDPLVAQSYGAGNLKDCHHTLHQGIFLSFVLSLPLMAISYALPELLFRWDINGVVAVAATPFIRALAWSTFPLLLYACLRRYLQAMKCVQSIMFALLTANLVNAFGNWVLIYGHMGFRAYGIVGSAWSTFFSRVYLTGFLAISIVIYERKNKAGLFHHRPQLDWQRLRHMLYLGFPAASQIMLEVGAFAAATVIAGRLAPVALAAHQIALNCASLTYMVPLGIGSATAVSVGHALGRKDPQSAVRVGWLGIALGAAFMSLSALVFILAPAQIIRLYTSNAGVIAMGSTLMVIAAFFQLFDGIQTVTTGALRGMGDTRSAMLLNLFSYWLLGLPLGYVLCFHLHMGAAGVWTGLSLSLVILAATLLMVWNRRSQSLIATAFLASPASQSY
ncbi:MAG TPA: MATE family efflux transporter [Acidobacteriaceae bacterium]|jgi:MATE family multidrug resistance protein|nr:MATE family efflux transporter [Acidobacteriaceae bacterium]